MVGVCAGGDELVVVVRVEEVEQRSRKKGPIQISSFALFSAHHFHDFDLSQVCRVHERRPPFLVDGLEQARGPKRRP